MSYSALEASLAQKAAVLQGKASKKTKKAWRQPVLDDFAKGEVLAFDQTFSKTGWAFAYYYGENIEVVDKGFIHEPPIPSEIPRFEDILQRTAWMGIRILEVLERWSAETRLFDVVHEAPILHGMRVESSLLGAVKVWEACDRLDRPKPVIVENRRMLNVLCPPDDRTGKPAITRGLLPFVDTSKRGSGWNEHNRDALALGLTHLYDRKAARANP